MILQYYASPPPFRGLYFCKKIKSSLVFMACRTKLKLFNFRHNLKSSGGDQTRFAGLKKRRPLPLLNCSTILGKLTFLSSSLFLIYSAQKSSSAAGFIPASPIETRETLSGFFSFMYLKTAPVLTKLPVIISPAPAALMSPWVPALVV